MLSGQSATVWVTDHCLMTRRRWIADEVSGNRAALTGAHARHLIRVLRARIGQEFDISTGAEVRRGRISGVHPDRVEFDLDEAIARAAQPAIAVAISIFKFDRMEWAIEKCTELGVARIAPVLAARSEAHLAAAAPKRVERWKRIVKQASEQSRRVAPPEVSAPVNLKDLLTFPAGTRIVLSEMERQQMLRDAVPQNAGSVILAFGPEGGWKRDEIIEFTRAAWISASLGDNILRAETAIIAGVAIAAAMLKPGTKR
ncbi:MAG TPA: RsmE family RNA methyltransferase [Terriglobales bacterium]|nr:RsmE family RNA methyltransferase [Terriglobales bacterium]